MKRILTLLIALAVLSCCSKEDIITTHTGDVIAFSEVFVNPATKAIDPSYNNNNQVNTFNVWGTVKSTSNTLVGLYATNGYGAKVTRNRAQDGFAFECSESEYWMPSTSYKFYAIAGETSVSLSNAIPSSINYTADGTTDLIYAESVEITTDAVCVPSGVNDYDCVAFTFNHLLSKVKFTFTNAFPENSGISLRVSNIQITNAYESGDLNISSKSWTYRNIKEEFFGHAVAADAAVVQDALIFAPNTSAVSNYERLLIPDDNTWKITFTIDYIKKDVNGVDAVMTSENKNVSLDTEFKSGYSYNLTANIENTFTPITFTVEAVSDFLNGTVDDDDFLNE